MTNRVKRFVFYLWDTEKRVESSIISDIFLIFGGSAIVASLISGGNPNAWGILSVILAGLTLLTVLLGVLTYPLFRRWSA